MRIDFFSLMLQHAPNNYDDDDDNGIYSTYATNLQRLKTHTTTEKQFICQLIFADAAALVAHTTHPLQRITSCFAKTAIYLHL